MPSLISRLRGKGKRGVSGAHPKDASGSSAADDTRPASGDAATEPKRDYEADAAHQKAVERFADEQEARRRNLMPCLTLQADGTTTAYGKLSDHPDANKLERVALSSLTADSIGKTVAVRARLNAHRDMSASLSFLVLRLQTTTVQAVLSFKAEIDADGAEVSHRMLQFAQHIPRDSVVLVVGEVTKPQSSDGRVHAVSAHDLEISVQKLFVISEALSRPFDLPLPTVGTDADGKSNGEDDKHPAIELPTRLAHRAFDLRAPVNQAIFRVQSRLCTLFRRFLEDEGFLEIHSAKLQASATESGASVFKVDYFGRAGFLAQSPQLAKQMCIAGDLERVFEVGPVFRAEDSNTVRHLTEYTGLDLEMTIERDYTELRTLVDRLLKTILRGLLEGCKAELELIRSVYPSDEFLLPDETPILDFDEGCKLLQEAGIEQDPNDDLSTANEKELGRIVREKFKTDYYMLDRFPTSARPFYTMRDPDDPKRSRSFDIFCGGQRVHDPDQLIENLIEAGIHPDSMRDYVDGFRFGAPPHGGIGLGLERATMLFLSLPNIRLCSLFPRDPGSLRTQELPPLIKPVEVKTKRTVFTVVNDSRRPADLLDGFRLERNTATESRFGVRED